MGMERNVLGKENVEIRHGILQSTLQDEGK